MRRYNRTITVYRSQHVSGNKRLVLEVRARIQTAGNRCRDRQNVRVRPVVEEQPRRFRCWLLPSSGGLVLPLKCTQQRGHRRCPIWCRFHRVVLLDVPHDGLYRTRCTITRGRRSSNYFEFDVNSYDDDDGRRELVVVPKAAPGCRDVLIISDVSEIIHSRCYLPRQLLKVHYDVDPATIPLTSRARPPE